MADFTKDEIERADTEGAKILADIADRAILTGSAARFLALAGEAIGFSRFDNRSEAGRVRFEILAAADAVTSAIEPLTETVYAGEASDLTRAVSALSSASAHDINEIIGRLPRLLSIVRERPTDAFALAHHLFGDDPSLVEAAYEDIVRRNRPRHPALMPPGRYEARAR